MTEDDDQSDTQNDRSELSRDEKIRIVALKEANISYDNCQSVKPRDITQLATFFEKYIRIGEVS